MAGPAKGDDTDMKTYFKMLERQSQERRQFRVQAGARQASETRRLMPLVIEAVKTGKVSSPWAISDLAKALNVHEDAVSYAVFKLEEKGAVKSVGTRPKSKSLWEGDEILHEVVALSFTVSNVVGPATQRTLYRDGKRIGYSVVIHGEEIGSHDDPLPLEKAGMLMVPFRLAWRVRTCSNIWQRALDRQKKEAKEGHASDEANTAAEVADLHLQRAQIELQNAVYGYALGDNSESHILPWAAEALAKLGAPPDGPSPPGPVVGQEEIEKARKAAAEWPKYGEMARLAQESVADIVCPPGEGNVDQS
jgi:DNA-binding Lrp family transcriptional regulator